MTDLIKGFMPIYFLVLFFVLQSCDKASESLKTETQTEVTENVKKEYSQEILDINAEKTMDKKIQKILASRPELDSFLRVEPNSNKVNNFVNAEEAWYYYRNNPYDGELLYANASNYGNDLPFFLRRVEICAISPTQVEVRGDLSSADYYYYIIGVKRRIAISDYAVTIMQRHNNAGYSWIQYAVCNQNDKSDCIMASTTLAYASILIKDQCKNAAANINATLDSQEGNWNRNVKRSTDFGGDNCQQSMTLHYNQL